MGEVTGEVMVSCVLGQEWLDGGASGKGLDIGRFGLGGKIGIVVSDQGRFG